MSALLRENERLLKAINRKKKDRETLVRRIRDAGVALAGTQPLIIEREGLDQEIHRLFQDLLARKRQPRGTRGLVVALYEMLQHTGVLSFHRSQRSEVGEDPADSFDDDPFSGGPHAPGPSPPDDGGTSARRPGSAPEDQSLRGLFRRLATALHPDKVHDEGEKARRTEVMKEISRAYEDRDLARLLNLERIWMAGSVPVVPEGDEIDRRCAHMERTNVALGAQLKTIVEELRELRRSPSALILKDLRRSAASGESDPIARLIAGANEEIVRTRELRDFVVSFRDGRISLDEFVRGPAAARQGEPGDDEEDDENDAYNAVMQMLFGEPVEPASAARGKRGRGRSRRSVRPGDVPF